MKKLIYASDGECGFGTIFGIGESVEAAQTDALKNGLTSLDEDGYTGYSDIGEVDLFYLDVSEAAYEELKANGGNYLDDDRFRISGHVLELA